MTQTTRDCPFCHNEVPVGAPRCKHCFGDLVAEARGARGGGPVLALIALLLAFAAIGSWIWFTVTGRVELGHVTVDGSGKRIVLIHRTHGGGFETSQVMFDQVTGVEMEANEYSLGGLYYEVYLITGGSSRVMVNHSQEDTLEPYARELAERLDKQLTIVDNIKSRHATPAAGG